MKYRKLGKTDLVLSEVGFGAWTVATDWWGHVEPEDGVKLLQRAVDLGVNVVDTADAYGDGFGEEIVAQALHTRRQQLVYATKFGYDLSVPQQPRVGHQERPQCWDAAFVRQACERSLRRLKTDYIDLYQLHNPKMDAIRSGELFQTLDDLVKEGKLRYYALALGPDIGWVEEGDAALTETGIAAMQIIYSILEQQPARHFFLLAAERGVGLLSRVPHASEVLTDKFRRAPPSFSATDHRSHRRQQWLQEAIQKVGKLAFLEEAYKHTPLSHLAIQFVLSEPVIASVFPNITSEADLEEYVGASEADALNPEHVAQLHELYDAGFGLTPAPSPAAAAG
ncbi:MAG: aldo/keto reductase [Dehalococcoidia bacterium]|nr:aldo/keto reductase [Dehalococcoidia bacterium]